MAKKTTIRKEFAALVKAALDFEGAGKTLHETLIIALPLGAGMVGVKPTATKACVAALMCGGMSETDADTWCKAHRVVLYRAWSALREELQVMGFELKAPNRRQPRQAVHDDGQTMHDDDDEPGIDARKSDTVTDSPARADDQDILDLAYMLSAMTVSEIVTAFDHLPAGRQAQLREALDIGGVES